MSKIFAVSAERQQRFAELAGDFNPLHTNELYARKTLFGKQVVHGIHQLLFLLERAADKIDAPFSIAQIKADFNNALGVNEPFTIDVSVTGNKGTAKLCTTGGTLCTSVSFDFEEKVAAQAVPDMSFAAAEPFVPAEYDVSGLTETVGCDKNLMKELFPALAEKSSEFPLGVLLASTRIVGMKYPGLQSIYNGLTLTFEKETGSVLRYDVKRHAALNVVTVTITGEGVTGRLKTMIRPESKEQTPLKDLKALRLDGCSDQRALIIGASRGIGLQCLRLLGLSGAETLFTFFKNKQEAENIQREFSENGLTTDFIQFDVTAPSREALEYIARFRPTHLYYFATPKISIGTGALSEDRFNGFAHTYIFALDNLIKETQDLKAVFAPSSVAIDELPKDMVEYAFAKAAMEVYARWIEKSRKLRFYTPRFSRIETDQTQSVLSVPAEKAENVLNRELSIFLNQNKDDEK